MQTLDDERWLPVVGYEGYYEVSDHGRVRGVSRVVPMKGSSKGRRTQGKQLTLKVHPNGGHIFTQLSRENKLTTRFVHHLVLEAFVGPRPKGCWGLHRDDVQSNNHVSNLYYGTPRQNSADARSNGSIARGEACGASVLTEAQVAQVKHLALAGLRQRDIAACVGVTQTCVCDILRGKTWAHTAAVVPKQARRRAERWRRLAAYPGYSISSWGFIRNNRRKVCLRPTKTVDGAYRTTLPTTSGRKNVTLHMLVFETFVRPLQPGEKCYHINGNVDDNYVENLAVTRGRMRSRLHRMQMQAESAVSRTLADTQLSLDVTAAGEKPSRR